MVLLPALISLLFDNSENFLSKAGVGMDGSYSFHDVVVVLNAQGFLGKEITNVGGHSHGKHSS